jgi:hypothetical protein
MVAPARENKRMRPLGVDDREFQIKVIWRTGNGLPLQVIRQDTRGCGGC